MMLSTLKPEEIARAILQGNARQLESIKGIGKKSAERIILELRDKIGKKIEETNISSTLSNTLEQDALNALITLGIARPAAEQAIRKITNEVSGTDKVEDIIKKALKIL
jgi:Holliday junction DNA helicase RuvA